jgi:hypothetical protein
VVDQATSVAIEIKHDSKKTFEEASGAAIYSNSELTVSSCISIFETPLDTIRIRQTEQDITSIFSDV